MAFILHVREFSIKIYSAITLTMQNYGLRFNELKLLLESHGRKIH